MSRVESRAGWPRPAGARELASGAEGSDGGVDDCRGDSKARLCGGRAVSAVGPSFSDGGEDMLADLMEAVGRADRDRALPLAVRAEAAGLNHPLVLVLAAEAAEQRGEDGAGGHASGAGRGAGPRSGRGLAAPDGCLRSAGPAGAGARRRGAGPRPRAGTHRHTWWRPARRLSRSATSTSRRNTTGWRPRPAAWRRSRAWPRFRCGVATRLRRATWRAACSRRRRSGSDRCSRWRAPTCWMATRPPPIGV